MLIIFGFLLNWSIFATPCLVSIQPGDTILYHSLANFLSHVTGNTSVTCSIFFIILLFVQALLLNKIINDQKMFSKSHYLIGMSYLLVISMGVFHRQVTAAFVANTFIIWILSMLFKLNNVHHPQKKIFNLGLLLGLTSLIYAPSLFFIFPVLFALSISRPFRLHEWIIVFLGLLTPYYFIVSINFLMDVKNINLIPSMFGFKIPFIVISNMQWVGLIVVAIISLIGVYFIQQNMRRLLVQSRNCWSILYLFFILALVLPFLNKTASFFDWIISVGPLSVLLSSFFFYSVNKWVNLIIFWALIGVSVAVSCFFISH